MTRRIVPGLFVWGFVLAMLLGNASLGAAQSVAPERAQPIAPVVQLQGADEAVIASEVIAQRTSASVAVPRTKSAVSPPEEDLPNRRPVTEPLRTAPAQKSAVAQPSARPVQNPRPAETAIVGQSAQAPPADAEYLPEDFFEQLQNEQPGGTDWNIAPAPKDASRPEIRGVWMTTSDMAVLRDKQALGRALEQLARLNFNTIYPVVWTRGYVTYPSEVAKAAGIPQLSRGLQGQDLLTDLTEQAHALGLSVIPWFEYGFMVPPQSELALLHPDWLTEQRNGQRTKRSSGKAMAWLNPFNAEVQVLLRDLAVDLVSHYDVDGIQFDDHMSLPRAFGYDELTRSRYKSETGHKVPLFATDRAWTQWRADQITYAMANLHRAVKSIQPDLVFSVSPNRYDFAYGHHLQDWKTWLERGMVDELIVQAYRRDYRDFVADLRRPEITQAKAQIPTGIGILTGLSDRRIGMYQIKQQVRAAQSEGLGVSFFFYQSLWDNAPESVAERKSGFRSIFPQAVPRIATRL